MSCNDCDHSKEGYSLVFVDWVDSCEPADNSDIDVYDMPEPQRLFNVGFLLHDEEDHIVVAGGFKPALETFDYVIAIPRVAINAIRPLDMFSGNTNEDA
tara:strand:+ start:3223 stop:3519 length:297 start_codon:yes stop_codon:yes gene_type:complete